MIQRGAGFAYHPPMTYSRLLPIVPALAGGALLSLVLAGCSDDAIPLYGGDGAAGGALDLATALDPTDFAMAPDLAVVPDLTGGLPRFSFFVTSLAAMRELAGSQNGFGGDLRFGQATGLAGADKICTTIAERSMPGAGTKGWRAFLSASSGGANGGATHAIERIGAGPWYDRTGRVVAMNIAGLVPGPRPSGDRAIINDLPNEDGVPNRQGTDNHDTLTGSNLQGRFGGDMRATCADWTSSVGSAGRPVLGHSWPRNANDLRNGGNWFSDHMAPGCAAGVNLIQNGPGDGTPIVGGGGGYGGIYCFALQP